MVQIDIQMPTDCSSCWVRNNMGCKIANASGWLNNKRDDNCPLKEQEAVKPKWFIDAHHPAGAFRCSSCGERIVEKDFDFYCSKCGKPILWEGQ